MNIIAVMAGGALGALFRYLIFLSMRSEQGLQFPYATLTANLIGCLCIGIIAALLPHEKYSQLQLFLTTGFLGGFTTFSSFGLESIHLFEQREYLKLTAYVLISNVAGLLLVWLGYKGVKHFVHL